MMRGSLIKARASSSSFFCPPGECLRPLGGQRRQLHRLEHRVGALAQAPLRRRDECRRREDAREPFPWLRLRVDHHVLQHRHPSERPRDLERARDSPPRDRVGGEPIEAIVAQTDLAAVGWCEAADHIEERRLARAVRSDETGDRALADGQRASGERLDTAEALGDPGDGEQWSRDGSPVAPDHTSYAAPTAADPAVRFRGTVVAFAQASRKRSRR
jgi:hypothetical protein